jgi:tetratricopeptide (TPR) repeat protein
MMDHSMAKASLAEGNFFEALEYDSTYGEAWYMLARNQHKAGFYSSAWRNINKAYRFTNPSPASWLWLRGLLEEKLEDQESAASSYRGCLKNMLADDDTAHFLDSCRFRLAVILQTRSKSDSVYDLLMNASLEARRQPSCVFLRGKSALALGYYSEALKLFQAMADTNFSRAESYVYLGEAYLAVADTAKACTAWDIALTDGSQRADTLLRKWCKFGSASGLSTITPKYVQPRPPS